MIVGRLQPQAHCNRTVLGGFQDALISNCVFFKSNVGSVLTIEEAVLFHFGFFVSNGTTETWERIADDYFGVAVD